MYMCMAIDKQSYVNFVVTLPSEGTFHRENTSEPRNKVTNNIEHLISRYRIRQNIRVGKLSRFSRIFSLPRKFSRECFCSSNAHSLAWPDLLFRTGCYHFQRGREIWPRETTMHTHHSTLLG